MIFSVHGCYKKQNSRKASSKIEAIVFARDMIKAEELFRRLFSGYPVDIEYFNTIHGNQDSLEEIYAQRPELYGISPDTGYIYKELYHKNIISKYFK